MRKIILIILFLNVNILNAGDEVQKIINVTWNEDISKRFCSGDCGLNEECKRAKNLCDVMVKLPLSTIDKELFSKILEATASSISKVLDFAVKRKIIKLKDTLPIYNAIYKTFPKSLPSEKLVDTAGIVEFFIDTALDTFIEYSVNNMTHEDVTRFRNNASVHWAIHNNAPDEDVKQALKWMLTLAKNDAKFVAYQYIFKSTAKAIEAGVIDNGLLLVEIGVNVIGSGFKALDATIQAKVSKKRGEIINLYAKYNKLYYPALNKKTILNNFRKECTSISLDGFTGFLASFSSGKNSLTFINKSLGDTCKRYEDGMIEKNRKKYYILYSDILYQDKVNFEKHLNYFFPKYKHDYAWRMFNNPKKFNIKTLSFYGDAYNKKVSKLLGYGFEVNDFNLAYINDPYDFPRRYTALNWVIKLENKFHLSGEKTLYEFFDETDNGRYYFPINRNDFINFIYDLYNIKEWYVYTDYIEGLTKLTSVKNNGWTKKSIGLNVLGILGGNPKKDNFRPNDKLTTYEAVTILSRIMDTHVALNTGEEY